MVSQGIAPEESVVTTTEALTVEQFEQLGVQKPGASEPVSGSIRLLCSDLRGALEITQILNSNTNDSSGLPLRGDWLVLNKTDDDGTFRFVNEELALSWKFSIENMPQIAKVKEDPKKDSSIEFVRARFSVSDFTKGKPTSNQVNTVTQALSDFLKKNPVMVYPVDREDASSTRAGSEALTAKFLV